jgi:hypothetical protein
MLRGRERARRRTDSLLSRRSSGEAGLSKQGAESGPGVRLSQKRTCGVWCGATGAARAAAHAVRRGRTGRPAGRRCCPGAGRRGTDRTANGASTLVSRCPVRIDTHDTSRPIPDPSQPSARSPNTACPPNAPAPPPRPTARRPHLEQLPQPRNHATLDELVHVDAAAADGVGRRAADAVDPLHHQHARPAQVGPDPGDLDAGVVAAVGGWRPGEGGLEGRVRGGAGRGAWRCGCGGERPP